MVHFGAAGKPKMQTDHPRGAARRWQCRHAEIVEHAPARREFLRRWRAGRRLWLPRATAQAATRHRLRGDALSRRAEWFRDRPTARRGGALAVP